MRVNCFTFIFMAWMAAIAFPAQSHVIATLPSEQVDTEQSTDGESDKSKQPVAIWDRATAWVWSMHHEFHRNLTSELQALSGKDGVGWTLVLISFLYGVLHAAGPGHGKVVLTTYLLTHRSRLNRGIAMGTAAALLQGVTALVLVYGLVGLAGWLPGETETASLWTARVSFTLLAIVGLYLLARAAGPLIHSIRQLRHNTDHTSHEHDHDSHSHDSHSHDSHSHDSHSHDSHSHDSHSHDGHSHDGHSHDGHSHDGHSHDGHSHDESCGCRHLPTVDEIEAVGSRHAAAGVVLAIGLRPCSGAVLVLILAAMMDLLWHGVFAVMAMSIGTAITIVALAILATKAREWASTVVAHRAPMWTLAAGGVGALGGVLILLLGLWLLNASFVLQPATGL